MAYCKPCDRPFASSQALWQHRQDSPNHNHVCKVCEKRFYSELSLRQHCNALSHHAAPISCHLGGKLFDTDVAKEQHLTSPKHTIVPCIYCPHSFRNGDLLLTHYKIAHAYCAECCQPFEDFQAMEEHFRHSPVHDPPMENTERIVRKREKPSARDNELSNDGLRKLLKNEEMLEHLKKGNGAALLPLELLAKIQRFLKGMDMKNIMKAVWEYIRANPYQTFFVLLGVFVIANPLALAGFGALGPIAGSIATGIQAGYGGTIVAGSAFAVCQSLGMTLGAGLFFPLVGGAIVGGALLFNKAKSWRDKWWNGGSEDEESDDDDDDSGEDYRKMVLRKGQ